MRKFILTAALVGLAACASDGDPRPVRWSYIHEAIILPNCATSGCHSTLSQTKGVDLEDKEKARLSVLDGEDGKLLLWGKRTDIPRMPPDQPLPVADIELIDRWIAGVKAGEIDD